LEFDIGILLDVVLIFSGAMQAAKDHDCGASSNGSRDGKNAGSALPTVFCAANEGLLAFGMPRARLSRRRQPGSAENVRNLTVWHLVCQK
jgi:hypothetical protein